MYGKEQKLLYLNLKIMSAETGSSFDVVLNVPATRAKTASWAKVAKDNCSCPLLPPSSSFDSYQQEYIM